MTAKILRKLKILGANQKYYVTDVKEITDDNYYLVDNRYGYFLTIRVENPKNHKATELLGHFFINNTSTVVMKPISQKIYMNIFMENILHLDKKEYFQFLSIY